MRWVAVVPFYNCENFISGTVASFGLNHFQVFEKIFLIDNASSDQSLVKAQAAIRKHFLSEKFVLLKNRKNYGLGGSFKVGLEKAKALGYSHLCFFHGNGQVHVEDISKFTTLFKDEPGISAVLGSRFMWSSQRQNLSFAKTMGNYLLSGMCSVFSKKWISDLGSGLNVYRLADLDISFVQKLSNHFAFDVELLLGLLDQKKDFAFVPITWKGSKGKPFFKSVITAKNILTTLVLWRFGILNTRQQLPEPLLCDEIAA